MATVPNSTAHAAARALPAYIPTGDPLATRRAVEDEIERLIAFLDAFDPNPDLEDDEIELLNEDGGDILDEPHDEEPLEAFLSSVETCGQTGVGIGDLEAEGHEDDPRGLWFDGTGTLVALGHLAVRDTSSNVVAFPGARS